MAAPLGVLLFVWQKLHNGAEGKKYEKETLSSVAAINLASFDFVSANTGWTSFQNR